MTTASLLAGAGALAVAAAIWSWVLWPLFAGASTAPPADPRVVALLAEREAAVAELRDVERDHADGRLRAEDYQRIRSEIVARGARIMAALDELAEQRRGHMEAAVQQLESEIEARMVPDGGTVEDRARAG